MLNQPRKLVLLAGDLVCLHLALLLTLVSRYSNSDLALNWQNHWPYFLPVFLIWLMVFYINDFYNLNLADNSKRWHNSLLGAATVSSTLTVLYFYLNLRSTIAPRTNLVLFIFFFLAALYLWRRLYQSYIKRFSPQSQLALFCSTENAASLLQQLQKNPGAGYITSYVTSEPNQIVAASRNLASQNIKMVVISEKFVPPDNLNRLITICWKNGIGLSDYAGFYEQISGKVAIEELDSTWFLKNIQSRQKKYFDWSKQVIDYFLAVLLLIITIPIWLVITISVKLSSPGSIFFRQIRLGRGGRPFTIIKFRTMTDHQSSQGHYPPRQLEITSAGRFLRQTRLDELPQLINILKGEMSFIGPRPEIPEIIEERQKQIPFYRMRLLVKPGLTGWDQISGCYHSSSYEDTVEKLQYDLFYLKQRSLYLDIVIMLKTLATIISRSGR